MDGAERRFVTIRQAVRITGLSEVFLRAGVKTGLLEELDAASRGNQEVKQGEAGPCG